jgi:hypothetical protein
MIVSASRRTDIPAFYPEWMTRRIREGWCAVPNPLNPRQVSRVSLLPHDVDVIVFWTRNPKPLMRHLGELDSRGLRYYFQFTILGYPREIDPKCPPLEGAIRVFRELSQRIGPLRAVWRYDPIVFSAMTPPDYHKRRFAAIARELAGCTKRAVISVVDDYRKAAPRMEALAAKGAGITDCGEAEFANLMQCLVAAAAENGIELTSCAEDLDLPCYGIRPGKCVDDALIREVFSINVSHQKDPSQRKNCGCVVSRDIGMYDSCLFGCPYCYATQNFDLANANYRKHDPQSPSLLGWREP